MKRDSDMTSGIDRSESVPAAVATAGGCKSVAREAPIARSGVVAFKDASKLRTWDAYSSDEGEEGIRSVLDNEKRCVTMERLCALRPFDEGEVGQLRCRTSSEIKASNWSVGCECLDRDYADWEAYRELLPMLGVKRGRLLSGWAKTEQERGVYDFAWLDRPVRDMAAMGIKPWIALAYGNPVWGSDFRLGMRVKQITENPEALAAWLRYVRAAVERYRDCVDEWEVWNEPYEQTEEYAVLFYDTARAVKSVQPEAKVLCTACGLNGTRAVIDYLRRENALDLAGTFIYHPYDENPDDTYRETDQELLEWQTRPHALRALVKEACADFDIRQGECGCPSQLEYAHALPNIEWTEYAQAKWDLRRAIGDAVRGIPSSLFSIIDNQYTFMLQSFGLIRSNTLKEFIYRRPSWFAMRNVYSLFDCDTLPVAFSTERVRPADGAERELSIARFERKGRPMTLFWFSDERPGSSLEFHHLDLARHFPAGDRLVWVELITGRIFRLPSTASVPVWDSPVLVCGCDAP